MTQLPEREIGREVAGALHRSTGSYELVVAALAAASLGFWIDYVFGLLPLFTLIFAVAGFIGAGYSIYLTYNQQMAAENAERNERRDARAGLTDTRPATASSNAAAEGGTR